MRQIKSLRVCLTGANKSQSGPVVAYAEPAATTVLANWLVLPESGLVRGTLRLISDSPAARPGPRATDTSAASVYACQIMTSKQVCFLIILGHSLISIFASSRCRRLNFTQRLCRQLTSWPDCHDSSPWAGPGTVRGEGRWFWWFSVLWNTSLKRLDCRGNRGQTVRISRRSFSF